MEMTTLKKKNWITRQTIVLVIRIATHIHQLIEIFSAPELNPKELTMVVLLIINDLLNVWRSYLNPKKGGRNDTKQS